MALLSLLRVKRCKDCLTGIVGHVDGLVPELTADLVDPVDAADDQHLVVQLRRDSHEQPHVQVVVVGHERLK